MPDKRQTAGESASAALVHEWADRAMTCAVAIMVDADPPRWVAKIEGPVGALGFGDTEQESLEDLRSGLPGWAAMKLELGATDILSAGGVSLRYPADGPMTSPADPGRGP